MIKLLRWVFSAVATVALITIFAEYSQQNKVLLADEVTSDAAETVPLTVVSSSASPKEPEGYILREYDGKLAIFKPGGAEPLYVFSVSMETMSDYDKTALQQGISADNLEELKTLVEDYTS